MRWLGDFALEAVRQHDCIHTMVTLIERLHGKPLYTSRFTATGTHKYNPVPCPELVQMISGPPALNQNVGGIKTTRVNINDQHPGTHYSPDDPTLVSTKVPLCTDHVRLRFGAVSAV